jgi:hypothetical protein
MSETYKLGDGKKYRLISVPQHWSLIEYWTRAGYGVFHDEDENPELIWEECHD